MAENPSGIPGAARGLIGGPRRRIALFVAAVLAWSVAFFALWQAASTPVSTAAGWVAALAMEAVAPVDKARASVVEGRVVVEVQPDAGIRYRNRVAEGTLFSISVNARKYTVALPFFLALVAASRSRRAVRIAAGIVVATAAAGLGIACEAAIGFAGTPLFRPGPAAATALAFGYQLGTLLVPTLVPIALWFWAAAESRRALEPE